MKVVRGGGVSDGSCGEEGIKQGREEADWLEGGEGDVIGVEARRAVSVARSSA
ncbi:unnamed protein product, partial [Rotaria magnacalcarata]